MFENEGGEGDQPGAVEDVAPGGEAGGAPEAPTTADAPEVDGGVEDQPVPDFWSAEERPDWEQGLEAIKESEGIDSFKVDWRQALADADPAVQKLVNNLRGDYTRKTQALSQREQEFQQEKALVEQGRAQLAAEREAMAKSILESPRLQAILAKSVEPPEGGVPDPWTKEGRAYEARQEAVRAAVEVVREFMGAFEAETSGHLQEVQQRLDAQRKERQDGAMAAWAKSKGDAWDRHGESMVNMIEGGLVNFDRNGDIPKQLDRILTFAMIEAGEHPQQIAARREQETENQRRAMRRQVSAPSRQPSGPTVDTSSMSLEQLLDAMEKNPDLIDQLDAQYGDGVGPMDYRR